MFLAPEFWVLVAFLLLLIGTGRKAYLHLTQALDAHTQKITAQLEEVDRLHHEALDLLQTYTQKHADALAQSKKIIAFADTEALEFRESKNRELDHLLIQKESALLTRLAHERAEMLDSLRQEITEESASIVKRLLSEDEKESKALTKKAVKKIALQCNEEAV